MLRGPSQPPAGIVNGTGDGDRFGTRTPTEGQSGRPIHIGAEDEAGTLRFGHPRGGLEREGASGSDTD
jgi:hypothetical protein